MLDPGLEASASSFPLELALGGKLEPLLAAPPEELADRVARAAARRDLFARLAAFDPKALVTRTIHRSASLEVVLSCWLPGQGIDAHDHGASRGIAAVVVGELVETRFRDEGGVAVPEGELALGPRATAVERPLGIHALANRGARPAVSLHVFVPRMDLRPWPARGG